MRLIPQWFATPAEVPAADCSHERFHSGASARNLFIMRRGVLIAMTFLMAAVLPGPSLASNPGCSRAEVRALVHNFIELYNRGDVDSLDKIWAQEPDFFWYFVDTDRLRRGPLAEDRSTLPLYFTERSMYADQLHLRKLRVAWERGWHGAWDISFRLDRASEEPGTSGRYHGKGAATCGRLHAWAMGKES